MLFDIYQDIKNFHLKYGLGQKDSPKVPSEAVVAHRVRMVTEEAKELVEALGTGDLVKIARECVDLLMVVLGTILVYGLPFKPIWKAVHEANMAKQRATGNAQAAKPIKPPGWQSPDRALKLAIYGRQKGQAQPPVDPTAVVAELVTPGGPVRTVEVTNSVEKSLDPTTGSSSAAVAPALPTDVPPAHIDPVAAATAAAEAVIADMLKPKE